MSNVSLDSCPEKNNKTHKGQIEVIDLTNVFV